MTLPTYNHLYNEKTTQGSTALNDCECNAGYSGESDSACVACTVGKYKSDTGSKDCDQCPANAETKDASGSTDISDCLCSAGFSGEIAASTDICTVQAYLKNIYKGGGGELSRVLCFA